MLGSFGPLGSNAGAQTASNRVVRSFPGAYATALAAAIWDVTAGDFSEFWASASIAIERVKTSTGQNRCAKKHFILSNSFSYLYVGLSAHYSPSRVAA